MLETQPFHDRPNACSNPVVGSDERVTRTMWVKYINVLPPASRMITGEDSVTPDMTINRPTSARIGDSAVGTALMIHKTGDAGCLILKSMVRLISRLILARIVIRICKVVMVRRIDSIRNVAPRNMNQIDFHQQHQ